MGILIIDGNSVFEIDEECYKKNKVSKDCNIDKYMRVDTMKKENMNIINMNDYENK